MADEQEQVVVEEEAPTIVQQPVTKGPSTKFTALIMTLFPLSIANWIIFGILYFVLVYFVIPYRLDPFTGDMVPDWKTSMPFTLALYFPISFAFHYITKSGLA